MLSRTGYELDTKKRYFFGTFCVRDLIHESDYEGRTKWESIKARALVSWMASKDT